MSASSDPEWNSGDPQTWSTYYKACYKLEGSPEVVVDQHCRRENVAHDTALKALTSALEEVAKHKVSVKGEAYVVKWQSRTQSRVFPKVVKDDNSRLVTGDWYGQFTVVNRGVYESEVLKNDSN